MTRREQSARSRQKNAGSRNISALNREALMMGMDPSQSLAWDDSGAKFTRSLARYTADTQRQPDVRWHTYLSSTRVLIARCAECSKGVAYLCISRATPWKTNQEFARYAFWRKFGSEADGCKHFGQLPDPETLIWDIARARRSRTGRRILQPDSPEDLADFGRTSYSIRLMTRM